MDVFSRTFVPAAVEAGVALPTVSRHLPVIRRCVEADDSTVLVTRCTGDYLLVLTNRRLVVTRESRVLHRLRLHLNANLRHLSNISWNPDPRSSMVDLAVTAVDGVRERFHMRVAGTDRAWDVEALLKHTFVERKRNLSLAA